MSPTFRNTALRRVFIVSFVMVLGIIAVLVFVEPKAADAILNDSSGSSEVDDRVPQGTGEPTEPPPPTDSPTDTPGDTTIVVASDHLGLVQISVNNVQPVYESPNGGLVRDAAGNELRLPNDADSSGADTYVVNGFAISDGEIWLSIFLGGGNPVWVPLSEVTVVSWIGLPEDE